MNNPSPFVCMIRNNGTKLLFELECDAPYDAINQMKEKLKNFDLVGGFFLDQILHKNIIQDFKSDWESYNQSLHGICYHPRFSEIFESMKRSSNFIYTDISWIYIGWKTDLADRYHL